MYIKAKSSESDAVEEKTCETRAELYLMCPDGRTKGEVDITLVNDDNVVECLEVWKSSATFHFDFAFQAMLKEGIKVKPHKACKYACAMNGDYEITLSFCSLSESDIRSSGEGAKSCIQMVCIWCPAGSNV